MNTAVINIKTDPKIKAKAQSVASELGLSLSAILNAYLKNFVRTKTVHFSLEEPSDYMIKALEESEADRKAGRVYTFDTEDKMFKHLDKIISNDKKLANS